MKKGAATLGENLGDWLINILIIFIVVGVITLTIIFHSSRKIDITETEVDSITNYLLNSDCITLKDIRTYPGVIDVEKLKNLKCLEKDKVAVNISLLTLDRRIVIISKTVNEELFKLSNPFCELKSKSFDCSKRNAYVLIKDNNQIKEGVLSLEFIRTNE